ncbi:MAG: sugar phosphate isomerase/epimerase family protein [Saprospiraceae bacterium]
MYDLGFVSAIFADKTFEEVIDFASDHGFKCVELMCWPLGKAERRYAGVTHIDVDALDELKINYIQSYLRKKNVYISGLGYYPNPLDADEEKRTFYINHIKKVISAAALLNIPVVNTFIGRHQMLGLKENLELFQKHWPSIIQHAGVNKVKIGIENCPMFFSTDEWPNGKNIAISPDIWQQLFDVEGGEHLGLNYDPSHLVWQQMDYLLPLKEFSEKLFHIHLKDAKVYRDKLNRVGILATPLEYHSPKLPGHGDINWKTFFESLRKSGYHGPVVIEFEDKSYESNEALIIQGLLETKTFVEQYC